MQSPIYTEKTICRDCYKCVRQCPVKAISVNDGSAVIVNELCIFCGKCIEVCPANAKKIRSDVSRAKQLIELNDTVIASLAPSFPAEFDCSSEQIIQALKKLGFAGVSETSIGAEIISTEIRKNLSSADGRIISSACPTVKELVRKYRPELTENLSELVSPLEAHSDLLKKIYGAGTKVVFIGPCISKKLEADDENTSIDLALSFIELAEWFEEAKIEPEKLYGTDEHFIPEKAVNAAEFAVEGGMLNTIKNDASVVESGLISCSGISNIMNTFDDITELADKEVFLEFLACDGGCISGRGMTCKSGYLKKRQKILEYYMEERKKLPGLQPETGIDISKPVAASPVIIPSFSEEQIKETLRTIDKTNSVDEINCGGCGYNTCRDFAAALLAGKAEQTMCVTNMRKLAERKSNALMKALPLGVVITDGDENILECNEKFLNLFSDIDPELAASAGEKIENSKFENFVPNCGIFKTLKKTGSGVREDRIKIDNRVFRTFAFQIGREDMMGAIFQDITSPAVQREMLIKKTEEVIEKSLSSVQQIASLLGENAAETQLILNSLIESYGENRFDERIH